MEWKRKCPYLSLVFYFGLFSLHVGILHVKTVHVGIPHWSGVQLSERHGMGAQLRHNKTNLSSVYIFIYCSIHSFYSWNIALFHIYLYRYILCMCYIYVLEFALDWWEPKVRNFYREPKVRNFPLSSGKCTILIWTQNLQHIKCCWQFMLV